MSARVGDAVFRRGRRRKAAGFLQAADDVMALGGEDILDAVVTLYVHAGIAAGDVICCARLGTYSSGENHQEAVGMLAKASLAESRHLTVLLGMKTKAGYSHRPASEADVKKAGRAASRLVESAREIAG